MFKSKKGMQELSVAGLGIGVFVIILVVVALIVAELQTQTTANTVAYNISKVGLDALYTLAKFLGIIAISIVAGYIIFIVVRSFRATGGGAV